MDGGGWRWRRGKTDRYSYHRWATKALDLIQNWNYIFFIFESLGIDELDDEETRILLEKEFDDFYEDQVHKSAGKNFFSIFET